MDIGIRTGFAYVTVGVVSSPLDGIVTIIPKDRMDGKGKYIAVSYAGPIRNAGGTAAAVSVIIADYVRKQLGYAAYDATPDETHRASVELQDYHERVTNLQYNPSEEELNFLLPRLPVEVAGEESEEFEVSSCKDLPRIPTNKIRSGYCLILSSCIPLKAPKLWKQLGKWGKDFGMEHWGFMEEFLALQKKIKSASGHAEKKDEKKDEKKEKITADYTYIKDLVAGRPILGHPLRPGAFRLRYGRSRASGLSGQSIHPATMIVLDNYIATGTQLKVERPGKGAAFTPCDTIEGPIVKLTNGNVLLLQTEAQARIIKSSIEEILFLGDVLIDVGDFINRAHILAPAGYCEEWWALEVKKALDEKSMITPAARAEYLQLPESLVESWFADPFHHIPSMAHARQVTERLGVALHPLYTYHWKDLTPEQGVYLLTALSKSTMHVDEQGVSKIVVSYDVLGKRSFEIAGIPHQLIANEHLVLETDVAQAVAFTFRMTAEDPRQFILQILPLVEQQGIYKTLLAQQLPLRDKSGTYIGSRMGRPEKAKMRKMTGSPHGLFPIGDQGGKMRTIKAAIEAGFAEVEAPRFVCDACHRETIFSMCDVCRSPTRETYWCEFCKRFIDTKECSAHKAPAKRYNERQIPVEEYVKNCLKLAEMYVLPDMVKGVRGTTSADHVPEHFVKSLLRAKHEIAVNKDGTIRYDASEVAYTHFKPKEVTTSIEKLKSCGYTHDIHGVPLEREDQILELLPQDVVLPACTVGPNDPCDKILLKIGNYIDDELKYLYQEEPILHWKKREDLVGQLLIALAPHTSAGLVTRIIGFTKSQGFLAHPYVHQACRRDCDGDEIGFMLLMDGFLNFSKRFLPSSRGSTMDAPLVLTSMLNPSEVDDQAFDVGIDAKYPLELYLGALEYKMPWEVKARIIKNVLGTPAQFEGMGFTHDTSDVNAGVLCSAYKTLPTMDDKLQGQMKLAVKIRAVDTSDVAQLVIQKHFLKDTKGNLRKFSQQEFRCVACNEKFRRPPLRGNCTKCKGKLVFTISEGSVIKYLLPAIDLAKTYNVDPYLKQTMLILERIVDSIFGRDKEKQLGLAGFG